MFEGQPQLTPQQHQQQMRLAQQQQQQYYSQQVDRYTDIYSHLKYYVFIRWGYSLLLYLYIQNILN